MHAYPLYIDTDPLQSLLLPPIPMTSLSKSLTLYLATALCTAAAYLLISALYRCLYRLLSQQLQHRSSAPSNDNNNNNTSTPSSSTMLELVGDPITKAQLQAHPVLTYADAESGSADACAVCLADYVVGDEIRVLLNCKHRFHKDCVDRWLVTRSSFCPICRERAIVRSAEHGDEIDGGESRLSVDEANLEYYPRRLQVRLEINVVPHGRLF